MEKYRVYWKQDFFTYIKASSPREAFDKFVDDGPDSIEPVEESCSGIEVVDLDGETYIYDQGE